MVNLVLLVKVFPIIPMVVLLFYLTDRLAEGEFIQGILDNEDALHFIQYEPPK